MAFIIRSHEMISILTLTTIKISFIGTAPNETVSKFDDIIIGLNALEFGGFDDFDNIDNVNITDLDHINLTDLYRRVKNRKNCTTIDDFFYPSLFNEMKLGDIPM